MTGAGEPSTRPVAVALANALFDATGRRLRRVPFTRQRVLAALLANAAQTALLVNSTFSKREP